MHEHKRRCSQDISMLTLPLPDLEFTRSCDDSFCFSLTPTPSFFGPFRLQNKYILPILPKKSQIPRISPTVLADLLRGEYADEYDKLFIIDCRYIYEFEGGHISGAMNCNDPIELKKIFFQKPAPRSIIVFHCEKSCSRGPQTAIAFRTIDRELHEKADDSLYYPDVYILDGGYKTFYHEYKEFCEGEYVMMDDERFIQNGMLQAETARFRENAERNQRKPLRKVSFSSINLRSPESKRVRTSQSFQSMQAMIDRMRDQTCLPGY